MIVYTYEVVATYTSCVGGGYSRSFPILYVNPTGESFTGLFKRWSSRGSYQRGELQRELLDGGACFYSVRSSSTPSRRRGSTWLKIGNTYIWDTQHIHVYTYLRRVQCIYPSLDVLLQFTVWDCINEILASISGRHFAWRIPARMPTCKVSIWCIYLSTNSPQYMFVCYALFMTS